MEKAALNLKEWDLEGHKTMYTEAVEVRKRQLEAFSKINMPYRNTEIGELANRSPSKILKPGDLKPNEFIFDEDDRNKHDVEERDMKDYLV
jgi:hypothetical protein